MIKALTLCALIHFTTLASAENPDSRNTQQPKPTPSEQKKYEPFDHNHSEWTTILKNFLIKKAANSQFNYATLKETPQSLNKYLEKLSSITNEQFNTWSDKQKMSFWINAYNAFTVKLILDNYPVKSIKDIGGFFSSPWKKEFFHLFGVKFYLDKIEHEILRKRFNEPRIHFAVNCASIGCPSLRDEAFVAEKLESQLEEQTRLFLKDTSRNSVSHDKKTITISKIFKWFKEDFGDKDENIIKFIFPYMKSDDDNLDFWKKYNLEYSEYNWDLNEVKN